jgi:hypothetical protein
MYKTRLPSVLTNARKRRRAAVLATALFGIMPVLASAAPRADGAPARISAPAAGVVYGGVTGDGFGLMVETNKSRSKIVRMATGLELKCTSGDSFYMPDSWGKLAVKKGKFRATYGPETQSMDSGGTVDIEGAVTGKFNRSKTRISGTWSLRGTEHDTTGAVTDTCDSGTIHWTAKQ